MILPTAPLKRILLALISLNFVGCGDLFSNSSSDKNQFEPVEGYQYETPSTAADQINVGHHQIVGVEDIALFQELMKKVNAGSYVGIDSILVAKDNVLFIEVSRKDKLDGADRELNNNDISRHSMMSVSKSFISSLVGIAIDEGFIANTEVQILDYFPDYFPIDNWQEEKAQITLADLLTMRHGYDALDNDVYPVLATKSDYVRAILDLPMISEPGAQYQYSTAISHLIGAVVERATGIPTIDYFQTRLFDPLGINNVMWSTSPVGRPETGRGLFIDNRAMLKFGLLFLNDGNWYGNQILSSGWVQESTKTFVDDSYRIPTSSYGFHWWQKTFLINQQPIDTFYAEGNGGQFIWVIKELQAVVTFTGRNYNKAESLQPYEMMEKYILPMLLKN